MQMQTKPSTKSARGTSCLQSVAGVSTPSACDSTCWMFSIPPEIHHRAQLIEDWKTCDGQVSNVLNELNSGRFDIEISRYLSVLDPSPISTGPICPLHQCDACSFAPCYRYSRYLPPPPSYGVAVLALKEVKLLDFSD